MSNFSEGVVMDTLDLPSIMHLKNGAGATLSLASGADVTFPSSRRSMDHAYGGFGN